ncbi:MAG: peptidoglycan editing factor PgeF [Candidatus Gastranaerophilales bacterium]|nr:peptidoglycan editing factor PgeF [Candidatus Gastranaerophilales bacterium]
MYKIKKINNKDVYYSDMLNIEHFFTTRNLIIRENKKEISDYLNIKEKNLICPNQTHSDNIEILEENKFEYPNCDGLIINKKDTAIYLNFADCTPIILYDPINNIGAVSHAGWRGTAANIASKTVLKMKEKFNSNPEDIIALIGPCISFEHFETSDEAIEKLSTTIKNKHGLFSNNHADLKGINKRQLEEIGVEKIDVCPFCTIENNDKFFSYRKENQTTKRHSALLKL